MKILYKKLNSICIIFTILLTSLLNSSSHHSLPLDVVVPTFFENKNTLADYLRYRGVCKEAKDRDDGDVVHNTINSIVWWSNKKLKEFLANRITTCIQNACFSKNEQISSDPRLGLDECNSDFFWSAWKKAVQKPLTAAFVCQYRINEKYNHWDVNDTSLQTFVYSGESNSYDKAKYSPNDYCFSPMNNVVRFAIYGRLLHQCEMLNIGWLNTQYELSHETKSLIFYSHTFLFPLSISGFEKIFDFLTYNRNAMENIALITFCGGFFDYKGEDLISQELDRKYLNILQKISSFLQNYPNVKISIQSQELDSFIRENKAIDENRLVNHIRKGSNTDTEYSWLTTLNIKNNNDFQAFFSPFFFFDWIGLCRDENIDIKDINSDEKKYNTYLKYKKAHGCEKMLTKIMVLLLSLRKIDDIDQLDALYYINTPALLEKIAEKIEIYRHFTFEVDDIDIIDTHEQVVVFFKKHPDLSKKLNPYIEKQNDKIAKLSSNASQNMIITSPNFRVTLQSIRFGRGLPLHDMDSYY